MTDPIRVAHALIDDALELYRLYPDTRTMLEGLHSRLEEPLRVALVGSVKAGKSTLLNGLLGERIAPTDARECTRIVTWYRYGRTPRVTATLTDGEERVLPAKRQPDRLELELHGLGPEDFERMDVTWPASGIEGITLIDTPGTVSISEEVSVQTERFLFPERGATGADAVIYLLRSLHEADLQYLHALDERTRHGVATIGSIAVLSRADELGGGRLTAMLSVQQAVEKLREHPALDRVCETVVPVAGLLGMGAMTLRQADFQAFQELASMEPSVTKPLLVSAERFIASPEEWLPHERVRADLVDRFGMYGIRLALAAIRGGISDAAALSAELLRRSGLDELRRVIDVHFRQRQAELKAHAVIFALHRLLREEPVPGVDELLVRTNEHMASAHTFTETHLLGRIAAGKLDLPANLLTDMARLVGGEGAAAHIRLGAKHPGADADELLTLAAQQLTQWREYMQNPFLDADTFDACRVAERSVEQLIDALMPEVFSAPV